MRHLLPFIGGFLGGAVGAFGFSGSAPDNQTLFGLVGGGGAFLFLGVVCWVLPAMPVQPPMTLEERQYRDWVASWTPPVQQQGYYPTSQAELDRRHQEHLRDQARMGWLMGDEHYPPTDWFGR
jgi:hypothetical protein